MILRKLLLVMIRFYQKHISSHFPPCCRYRPSCSHYGFSAIERFGVLRGVWLTGLRILRCNPFSKGGWDPVPIRFDFLGRHKILIPDPLSAAQKRALSFGMQLAERTRYHGHLTK